MKTKIFVLALFIHIFAYSQEKKVDISVNYKLVYKLDSTSNELKKENFILFADKEKSIYQSIVTYVKDSLLKNTNVNRTIVIKKYTTPNNYIITNDLKNESLSYFQSFFNTKIYYKENKKIIWKLENETKNISNIDCQKATTELFGRKWIAWYSQEYPFPFGPYKFYGLPGLILELYDSKNDYYFSVYRIKKEKNTIINFDLQKNYIETNKNKFLEIADKNTYDANFIFSNITFDDPSVLQRVNEKIKARKKRENNPIELTR